MRARRAFTLLEVTLAAVIGSVIVLACLAVFGAMDGVDRALTRKLDETAEMAKLHLVMQRTFSTLVMSDQPPPRVARPGDTTGAAGTQSGAGTGTGARPSGATSGSGSATSGSGSSGSGTALRSSTAGGSETTSGATGTSGRTTSTTGSASSTSSSSSRTGDSSAATDEKTPLGRFIIAPTATTPAVIGQPAAQRLEVVVKKAPLANPRETEQTRRTITTTEVKLPAQSGKSKATDGQAIEGQSGDGKTASGSASGSGTGSASTASATGTGDQKESESAATRTTTLETTGEPTGVRGYFELVKESALPDYRPPRPGAVPPLESWALLWTPVPEGAATATGTGTLTSGLSSPLPVEPLVVARGIASLRWRVFDDRERKDQFNAVWSNQLPAYVEMDVQTISGLRASWLFEVEWGTGPEPGEAPAVAFGGGGGGGGPGGGGFRGRGEGEGPGRGLPGGGPQRIRRGEGQQQGGETAMPGQQRRRRDGQQADGGIRRDGARPPQQLPGQPNPARPQTGQRPQGRPRPQGQGQPRRQP